MKTSSLAERLEEFEAAHGSLKLENEPPTRVVVTRGLAADTAAAQRPVRRAFRVRGIEIRDQGLRLFRVS